MLIHNTTFMILREKEPQFLDWLHNHIGALTSSEWHGAAPRLSAMRQAGGVSHLDDEAQSIAFQMEFEKREDLDRWAALILADVIDRFYAAFAPDAVAFTSIFETLPL